MSEQVKIKVEDSAFPAEKGTPLSKVLPGQAPGRKPMLVKSGNRLLDLSFPAEADMEISIVYPDSPEALGVLRHSAAHLLAHAVLDLYPETKTGIGPAVENGYYYDFLRQTPFTPEDLEAIEKRMKEIAAENLPVKRLVLEKEEAIRLSRGRARSLRSSSSGRRATPGSLSTSRGVSLTSASVHMSPLPASSSM
jgi:threonyl-tRNA synthetase